MKQCISTEQTLKAIEAGARLMLVKIDEKYKNIEVRDDMISYEVETPEDQYISGYFSNDYIEDFIESRLQFKQGDEICIAEEVFISLSSGLGMYKRDIPIEHRAKFTGLWELCSEQQSRFKFKVGEVSVERVQDISKLEMYRMLHSDKGIYLIRDIVSDFIDWLEDQGINYNDNQYVALVKLKETR